MNYVYLVTMLMLVEYLFIGYLVSRARSTYKVVAPAVTGNEAFERHFRVQQNTIEQLVVVLPSMWIYGLTVSPLWAALFGLVFVVARAFYAYGYIKTGGGRHYGFMVGLFATIALLVGGAIGAIKGFF